MDINSINWIFVIINLIHVAIFAITIWTWVIGASHYRTLLRQIRQSERYIDNYPNIQNSSSIVAKIVNSEAPVEQKVDSINSHVQTNISISSLNMNIGLLWLTLASTPFWVWSFNLSFAGLLEAERALLRLIAVTILYTGSIIAINALIKNKNKHITMLIQNFILSRLRFIKK